MNISIEEMPREIDRLLEENERLNNNIQILQDDIDNIGQILGYEEGSCYEDITEEIKELQDRIDKAIEYIEHNAPWGEETEDGDFVSGKLLHDDDIDYVLEILKGSDKE